MKMSTIGGAEMKTSRRTIFMGDFIYAFSGAGITVHNLTSMELTDVVTFDIEYPTYAYYDN